MMLPQIHEDIMNKFRQLSEKIKRNFQKLWYSFKANEFCIDTLLMSNDVEGNCLMADPDKIFFLKKSLYFHRFDKWFSSKSALPGTGTSTQWEPAS